eukprot:COSAG06_NODE_6539_length_2889_cov_2.442852_2_plen_62_part_00
MSCHTLSQHTILYINRRMEEADRANKLELVRVREEMAAQAALQLAAGTYFNAKKNEKGLKI